MDTTPTDPGADAAAERAVSDTPPEAPPPGRSPAGPDTQATADLDDPALPGPGPATDVGTPAPTPAVFDPPADDLFATPGADDDAAPAGLTRSSGHPEPAPAETRAKRRRNPLGKPDPGHVVPPPPFTPDQEVTVAKHDDARAAAGARKDDAMIEALEAERAGYAARGLDDRVAQVDAQLALRRGEAPKSRSTPSAGKSTA